MNISDFMAKHGLTDEMLDEMARPYENGDYKHSDRPIQLGSHLDAVGQKRITVIYPATSTTLVQQIAKSRGVKPSEIYREALAEYLEDKRPLAVG